MVVVIGSGGGVGTVCGREVEALLHSLPLPFFYLIWLKERYIQIGTNSFATLIETDFLSNLDYLSILYLLRILSQAKCL